MCRFPLKIFRSRKPPVSTLCRNFISMFKTSGFAFDPIEIAENAAEVNNSAVGTEMLSIEALSEFASRALKKMSNEAPLNPTLVEFFQDPQAQVKQVKNRGSEETYTALNFVSSYKKKLKNTSSGFTGSAHYIDGELLAIGRFSCGAQIWVFKLNDSGIEKVNNLSEDTKFNVGDTCQAAQCILAKQEMQE